MSFIRQVLVLVYKNILIAFFRRPISTTLRALVLPIIIGWFFSYAQNFFSTPSTYGVGTPNNVRSFEDALAYTGTRNQLVFVNNGFQGGQIERIITEVGNIARNAGKNVRTVRAENELLTTCRNTLRGASSCIAGVVFHSTPTEPLGQNLLYNYTLRFDGVFGATIDVDSDTNDQEIFLLPLQRAIDRAIANANGTLNTNAVPSIREFPYTSITQAQRNLNIRRSYLSYVIRYLAVGFFIGMCGIQYQQVGAQATERENKMSQLLEVMMPNKRRWIPQIVRLLSYSTAFTLLYLPGWVIMAVILKINVFVTVPMGIVIGLHILTGLSLASFSLFAAAFFKKAQLSGITAILISIIVAIVVQIIPLIRPLPATTRYVLSGIFPSVNYVSSIIFTAQIERTNSLRAVPAQVPYFSNAGYAGTIYFSLFGAQTIVYLLLAILVERLLWGTASTKRHLSKDSTGSAVELRNFSKHFQPGLLARFFSFITFKKGKETVKAVDDLNFAVHKGQIVVLLGANGSGKSTTLNAIAGLSKPTHGDVTVNFEHGIGFCPQQNVLWKDLTVYEHVKIFDHLKSVGGRSSRSQRYGLIDDCDLSRKVYSKAGSLSGGQMRKLQLALMFIGNSGVCLVDECSSGIDPLARKKVQDILLAERSRSQRTIIFTSHYLDEADIADYILIMSKGKLKVRGTAPEIKNTGQYRVHIYHSPGQTHLPEFENVHRREMYDQTVYTVDDATSASQLLTKIEAQGHRDYSVNGPTVEDAFMSVAEEMVPSQDRVVEASANHKSTANGTAVVPGLRSAPEETDSTHSVDKGLNLHSGTHIGPFRQAFVLFCKRGRVFLRGVYPNLAALLIVPIGAGLTGTFLDGFQRAGCIPEENALAGQSYSLLSAIGTSRAGLVLGPRSAWNTTSLGYIIGSLPAYIRPLVLGSANSFFNGTQFVNSGNEMYQYISNNPTRASTGGVFLGANSDQPIIGYQAGSAYNIPLSVMLQNIVDIVRYRNPISLQYQPFDFPWQAGQGDTLQYAIYFAFVISVAPAFFALYPTLERIRHVRSLHYSNGVRALPLWLSYILFDSMFIVVAATISVVVLAAQYSPVLFGIGEFWLVMVLYGICATLFSYVVSLFARSQLAAFAISAAYQAATALIWLIAYLSLLTYGDPGYIDRNLNYAHYTLSLVMPSGSMFKSLFMSLNVLSINCRGTQDYVSSPGDITAYGAPILYLILQSLLLFTILVWWESGNKFGAIFRATHRLPDQEEKKQVEPEVAAELSRVNDSTNDGLKVLHLSKAYGKNLAVDDASFGVQRGEVFGLLGPNGAGKSTTISVIRGDVKLNSGEIYIENVSLAKKRNLARQHLSACPQHDAMDRLTVTEHLKFYARVRGVKDVKHNVREVIRAVGLTKFEHRMAENLSGGNKRKLSLGIALMGNPTVMLLDEPSSGMDVAAKRIMWRTLESVVSGRSIVLTTHSMEEADRLCTRAGILAKRMLTVGTIDHLKTQHGDKYYVHLLLKSAPYTTTVEESTVIAWIKRTFPGAEIDDRSHHGQIRFSIPIHANASQSHEAHPHSEDTRPSSTFPTNTNTSGMRIAPLFATLENNKNTMGFEYYSVGHATLDQVFLSIVTKHNVEEENSQAQNARARSWTRRLRALF